MAFKKMKAVSGLIMAFMLVSGCLGQSREACLKAWEDKAKGAIFIDVRSSEEFAAGHIENAIHIPWNEIGNRIGTLVPDKSKTILLYCAAGVRAGRAEDVLLKRGYKAARNVGGYSALMGCRTKK